MNSKIKLAGIAATLALGAISTAQFGQGDRPDFMEGTWRLSVGGRFLEIEDEDATTIRGDAFFFVSENLELGGGLVWNEVDGTSSTVFQLGGNYYISEPGSTTPWYLGVRLIGIENGISETGWAGAAGVHFFASENFSFSPELIIGEIDGSSFTSIGAFFTWWTSSN